MLTSSSGDVGPRKGDTGHSEPGERPGRQFAHGFVVVSEGAGLEHPSVLVLNALIAHQLEHLSLGYTPLRSMFPSSTLSSPRSQARPHHIQNPKSGTERTGFLCSSSGPNTRGR